MSLQAGSAWVGVVLAALAGRAAADAARDYEMLFGKEDRSATATSATADDAALARKLADAAKATGDAPELKRLLCRKALAFGVKSPAGCAAALEAVALLEAALPDERPACLRMRLDVCSARYRWAPRGERPAAAEDYLRAAMACAEDDVSAGRLDAAAALYAKAYPVARYNRLALLAEIVSRRKALTQRMAAETRSRARLKSLSAAMAKDPTDVRAREALIRLHLVERDDVASANKLLTPNVSEVLRTCVPLAAKPIAQTPEAQCLELAQWYRRLADQAPQAYRPKPLSRAAGYVRRFLSLRKTDDVRSLQARLLLKGALDELGRLGVACVGTAKWFDGLRRLSENNLLAMPGRLCHGEGKSFREMPKAGGLLVGLKVSYHMYSIHRTIGSVQPIFLTAAGRVEGQVYGQESKDVHVVEARSGYAVGGLGGTACHRVDGLRLVFMKIGRDGLDATQRYDSEWLGGNKGQVDTQLAGDGQFVVGIGGTCKDHLRSLGIIQARALSAAVTGGSLDLVVLMPQSVDVGWRTLTVNRPIDREGPTLEGKACRRYLGAHAPSHVVYRLPAWARGKRLLARGFMGAENSRNGVKFIVRIDGKTVYQSREVTKTASWVDIAVRIPAGARKLELAVGDLGDREGKHAYWVRPRIE